jgi:hypothetical protein
MGAALLLGAAAGALYWREIRDDGTLRPSSWLGIGFGVAATAIMLFEAALNLRKRVPTWLLGRAETWLKGHIWLGLLCLPLALFHSNFALGGRLSTALMLVLVAMLASGVYGLVLQQYLPRLMTTSAPGETIFEQIPHVIEQLRLEAYDVAATVCGVLPDAAEEKKASEAVQADPRRARRVAPRRPADVAVADSEPLKLFYLQHVRPYLRSDGRTGTLANPATASSMVETVCRQLPEALRESARDLGEIVAERRDLAVQRRIHLWLHTWLLVHVPLTAALFVLLAAHVWWAVRYSY